MQGKIDYLGPDKLLCHTTGDKGKLPIKGYFTDMGISDYKGRTTARETHGQTNHFMFGHCSNEGG